MRKIILPYQTYFVTTNIKDRVWIFADRREMGFPPAREGAADPFSRSRRSLSAAEQGLVVPNEQINHILRDNLNFYRAKFSFLLHGLVFMPDHVHLLLTVGKNYTISDIMRDWKHRTGFEINHLLDRRGCLWQRDFWEHAIRNDLDFAEKLNYIHQNPVRAGLSENAQSYQWSSASGKWDLSEIEIIG